jgi:addiction module RelE/StbE family toxin
VRIAWTEPALRDLQALRAYIERDNLEAARHQVERILKMVEGLTQFPESGRPGRRTGTRELVVGRTPYLVAYRIRGDVVEVLRVLHGRRIWPDLA